MLQGTGVPVGFGVDVQAVLEFDSHSFNEGAGVLDFMSVLGHDRHANGDWQPSGYKALQPADERFEGSRHAGDAFVRVLCRAVDRDGEAAELRLLQAIGNLGRDARRVRNQLQEQPQALRVLEDGEHIGPDERFPSCESERDDAHIRALIQNGEDFFRAQFLRQDAVRGVVAMDTPQIASIGQLERHRLWRSRLACLGRE